VGVEVCRATDCCVDIVRPSEGEGCADVASRGDAGTELRSGAIFVVSSWLVVVEGNCGSIEDEMRSAEVSGGATTTDEVRQSRSLSFHYFVVMTVCSPSRDVLVLADLL
jgi:hypothetical protein